MTSGETGFVVPVRKPGVVAGVVCRLLADPAGARRMAEASRVQVERDLVAQLTAAKTMDVYHRLLDLRQRTIAA